MPRDRTDPEPETTGGIAEDRRLVLLAREGDASAFGDLVRKYAGVVRALVTARLGPGADAEDAAQDVFLRAFERLGSLEDPERFAGWLTTIAVNRALESRRTAERRRTGSLEALAAEPAAPPAGAGDRAERAEETERMLALLGTLDDRTRNVLLLRFRDGMAVKDVAARLGEQPPAVAMRISRGLRKLRALLVERGVRP